MTHAHYDSLAGRTTIITGGASGIGEAFVRGFVRNGARVAFLDMAVAEGEALATETGALFLPCDLRDIPALTAAIAAAEASLGPCRVLVNNAARDTRLAFDTLTEAEFEDGMATNFRHVVFACKAVVPSMRTAGGGAIVNMSSVAWMGGGRQMEVYAAAKAAIVGFTNSLARDVGPDRIRVNAIAPGMIITERQRRLWFQDESQIAAGLSHQCLPDLIAVEDVADLALFLASDASRLITKQCICINGGSR
jgi:NAD(P)-dependent dehydrogenase (short-subunit alcohol dehydrogenase family)